MSNLLPLTNAGTSSKSSVEMRPLIDTYAGKIEQVAEYSLGITTSPSIDLDERSFSDIAQVMTGIKGEWPILSGVDRLQDYVQQCGDVDDLPARAQAWLNSESSLSSKLKKAIMLGSVAIVSGLALAILPSALYTGDSGPMKLFIAVLTALSGTVLFGFGLTWIMQFAAQDSRHSDRREVWADSLPANVNEARRHLRALHGFLASIEVCANSNEDASLLDCITDVRASLDSLFDTYGVLDQDKRRSLRWRVTLSLLQNYDPKWQVFVSQVAQQIGMSQDALSTASASWQILEAQSKVLGITDEFQSYAEALRQCNGSQEKQIATCFESAQKRLRELGTQWLGGAAAFVDYHSNEDLSLAHTIHTVMWQVVHNKIAGLSLPFTSDFGRRFRALRDENPIPH